MKMDLYNYLKEKTNLSENGLKPLCASLRHRSVFREETSIILVMGLDHDHLLKLIKSIASFFFESEEAILHIPMSNYANRESVNELFGGISKGYIGYGNNMTNPFPVFKGKEKSVILFEEIDKAHAEVNLSLLQIMGENKISNKAEKVFDFSQSIIILTVSNANNESVNQNIRDKFDFHELNMLHLNLRPELIARLNVIIKF